MAVLAGAKAWGRKRPRTLAGWVWKGFTALAGGFVLLVLGLVGVYLVVLLLAIAWNLAMHSSDKDTPIPSPGSVVDLHLRAHLFRVPLYWVPFQLNYYGDQELIAFNSIYYPDFSYDNPDPSRGPNAYRPGWYYQTVSLDLEEQAPFLYDDLVRQDKNSGKKIELRPAKYGLLEIYNGDYPRRETGGRLYRAAAGGIVGIISCDDPSLSHDPSSIERCEYDASYEDLTLEIDFDIRNLSHWQDIYNKSMNFVRSFEVETKK